MQTFAQRDNKPAQEYGANRARADKAASSRNQAQPAVSQSGWGCASSDFSNVPLERPAVKISGGGNDPSLPQGTPAPAPPAADNLPDTAPRTEPPQTNPAQGGATPMAVTAVDKITANIGPTAVNVAHVPPCGTQPAIRFTATPRTAAPVTWTIDSGPAAAGTVLTPSADTLSASLALGPTQTAGELDIKAESTAGGQIMPYLLASHPVGINSTRAVGDPTNTALYGGVFNHEFKSADGKPASLDQVTVGERFPKLPTPEAATHQFESDFGPTTLHTGTMPNTPNASSGDWILTSAGELGGNADTVSGPKKDIDIGRHIVSGSNPHPAHPLPVQSVYDQEFHWWCPHAASGSRWTHAADTTQTHILRMDKSGTGAEYVAIVNKQENVMAYDGDPAVVKTGVINARADTPTIAATAAGGTPNTVQISADAIPSGRQLFFSIQGAPLGCTINHASGELQIGRQVGKVRVRAANKNGGTNWDEVEVTITAAGGAPPPVQTPAPATPHGAGATAPVEP